MDPESGSAVKGEDPIPSLNESVLLEGVTLDRPGESSDLLVGEIVPDEEPCEEVLPLKACETNAPLLKGVSCLPVDEVR